MPEAVIIAEGNPMSIPRPMVAMFEKGIDVLAMCFVTGKSDKLSEFEYLARVRLSHAVEAVSNGNSDLKDALTDRITIVNPASHVLSLFPF